MAEHRVTVQAYGDDEIPSELHLVCSAPECVELIAVWIDGEAPSWPTPAELWRVEHEHLSQVAAATRIRR